MCDSTFLDFCFIHFTFYSKSEIKDVAAFVSSRFPFNVSSRTYLTPTSITKVTTPKARQTKKISRENRSKIIRSYFPKRERERKERLGWRNRGQSRDARPPPHHFSILLRKTPVYCNRRWVAHTRVVVHRHLLKMKLFYFITKLIWVIQQEGFIFCLRYLLLKYFSVWNVSHNVLSFHLKKEEEDSNERSHFGSDWQRWAAHTGWCVCVRIPPMRKENWKWRDPLDRCTHIP